MKQNLFKKSLLFILCLVAAGLGQSNIVLAQASKTPASIVALNTDSSGSESAVVTIESSQPVQYTAFKLLNPLRLVLDFPNMQKGNLSGKVQVNKGLVDSIRPLHFEEAGVLRLEIALNRAADYEILKPEKNILVINLKAMALEMANATKSNPENKAVKKTGQKDHKDAATILSEAEEVNDDTCYPMLYGKKETITLDFQDADVRNLIRIFADISGFNIILSPGLSGSVNMRLTDVPWNEAMEVILANNALGRECLGNNIVRIATQSTLASEESARTAKKARIATDLATQRNAQELVTEVVRINNANITDLTVSLNALKSTRVDARVTVDARTNTIILNDLRHHVDDMLETIRVLDVATAQVLIEAKIVEISKSFSQALGIQWGFTGNIGQNPSTTALLQGAPSGDIVGTTASTTEVGPAVVSAATSNFLVDLSQASSFGVGNAAGFGLSVGNVINELALNLQLEALETQGKGRILSSPKVTTSDNKEATIKSGRQIPYQTVSTDGTTIEFVNAELSMTVLPHVTFDDKVYMSIDTTNNAADFSNLVNSVPTITTKETHTEVLVGNKATTVLGGIYSKSTTDSEKAVPFFSKIPFLGALFRSTNEAETINELLIFVTPTIVDNGYN
jgi:type IV pilus assembly protein PilQ